MKMGWPDGRTDRLPGREKPEFWGLRVRGWVQLRAQCPGLPQL